LTSKPVEKTEAIFHTFQQLIAQSLNYLLDLTFGLSFATVDIIFNENHIF
jgi:hypothetical protein